MKFTKCTVIPKLKFTKCTGIPKLMSINNCNLPRWRIPKMKFSPNWNQYQMMSTQRWEFFTVGQFQFGKISKWMDLNLVGNQFGSFTMGVNLKKVNINLEFVSERFEGCLWTCALNYLVTMPLKTEELSVVDKGGFLIEKTLWGVYCKVDHCNLWYKYKVYGWWCMMMRR